MTARWGLVGLAVALLSVGACDRERKAVEEDLPAARATRARADAQQIASAVRLYQSTFGALPESLDALTRPQAAGGVTAGPFLAAIPPPPAGWSRYEYTRHGADRFTISSSGGGATVTAP